MLGNLLLSVIKNPAGTFNLVGPVPAALAFEGDLTEELLSIAKNCGPGFASRTAAREGCVFKTRTWPTAEAAIADAAALGFQAHS